MPDIGVISDVVGLGVGAVIAIIVLLWKRGDDQRYQKALEDMEKQHQDNMTAMEKQHQDDLKAMIERMDHRDGENRAIIEANTAALKSVENAVTMTVKAIEAMSSLRNIEEQVRGLMTLASKMKSK